MEDGERFAGRDGFRGDLIHDCAGCVDRAVVDGDDGEGDGLGEEGAEGGFDAGRFVAGRNDDGDFGGRRRGCGLVVVLRVEEAGNARQVVQRGEGDAGPGECDEPGEDDGEDVEDVHGQRCPAGDDGSRSGRRGAKREP